eukprot:1319156-Amorphochlora_amoeboformis.AAC.1
MPRRAAGNQGRGASRARRNGERFTSTFLSVVTIFVGVMCVWMVLGLVGQCIDEVRLVTIPPQLAYDHPEMNFGAGRKPVPEGSTVAYRMKVVYIAPRPGSFAYLMAPVQ